MKKLLLLLAISISLLTGCLDSLIVKPTYDSRLLVKCVDLPQVNTMRDPKDVLNNKAEETILYVECAKRHNSLVDELRK